MTTFAGALVAAGTTRSSSVSEMRPRPTSYGTTVNSGSLCANAGAAIASAAADAASRPQNVRFKEHLPIERARSGAGAGARARIPTLRGAAGYGLRSRSASSTVSSGGVCMGRVVFVSALVGAIVVGAASAATLGGVRTYPVGANPYAAVVADLG